MPLTPRFKDWLDQRKQTQRRDAGAQATGQSQSDLLTTDNAEGNYHCTCPADSTLNTNAILAIFM